MEPQGKTLNMFLLKLMHTELKTDSEKAAAMNFKQQQQSALTGHSLSPCLFPTEGRSCFPDLHFPAAADPRQCLRAVLSWGTLSPHTFQSRALSTDLHSSTPDTAGKGDEQKWWVWKPVLASQHTFVVWSRTHNQASPLAVAKGFLSMVLNLGWAAGARGCPGGAVSESCALLCTPPCQSLCWARPVNVLLSFWKEFGVCEVNNG